MERSELARSIDAFTSLIEKTTNVMTQEAISKGDDHFRKFTGVKMEPLLVRYLQEAAVGTCFEGKIREASEFAFPDILVGEDIGIEVKTTDKGTWTSIGNSILESSRVPGIKTVYIFFVKMKPHVEFKYRLYEDCLSGVVVTHYPRYQINMDLPSGQTIFDKIGEPYETIRAQENPAKQVLQYYRKQASDTNSQLWWMDIDKAESIEHEQASPPIIRFLSDIDEHTREELISQIFAYFPEITAGGSRAKYKRCLSWLLVDKSIIVPNVRDFFTAGGVGEICCNNHTYMKVPRVICNLHERLSSITSILNNMDNSDIGKIWGMDIGQRGSIDVWQELVISHAKERFDRIEDLLKDAIADEKA